MASRRIALLAVVLVFSLSTMRQGFAQTAAPAQTQKPPVGPAAPQSRHFPVLLLAVGMNPAWDLRIGPNGPERLDRPAYPPITLEPGEISQESPTTWLYHAKDTGTGAPVIVMLSREACSDGSATKYSFKATVQHTQLGTMNGCARIAAELYPHAYSQEQQDDTDDDDAAAKKKPPLDPSLANFKMPIDTAYLTATQKVVLRHGAVPHVVAQEGSQLSLSHDGKKLLYTREAKETGTRAIMLYEAGKSTELLTGDVQQAFWAPDDTRLAFLKMADGAWHLWIAPVAAPATATAVFPGTVLTIQGWADAHTILVDDLQQLSWVRDDGSVLRTVPDKDVYGEFVSSGNTVRVHPQNPDLLLVSAEMAKRAETPTAAKGGTGAGFFLYEIASKRRVVLSPPELLAGHAEWSRDGLQIFFTGTDASRRTATWRMFWDGSDPKRYLDGRELVIGQ
jgi:uncharacterized membrane protein